MDIVTKNILFGIIISLLSYELGLLIYTKSKLAILNPLLIAIISTIAFLVIFNISVTTYNDGAKFINAFLGPATVVLAVPLYKQLQLLKENLISIVVGIFLGCFVAITSVIFLCITLSLDKSITASLVSKSVTTPIGIEIASSLGGITPITVLAIILSGITGAIVGPVICKVFKIKDDMAVGIAIGTASHAVGTTKALELGETQGAMSSLSIGLAGIITVFLAPICFKILTTLL